MKTQTPLWNRIRLVYRRGSTLAKVVVLSAIVLSTAALLTLQSTIQNTQSQSENLKSQAAKLEQENDRLEQDISELGSLDSMENIAQDELGLVDPDTVIIVPKQ